MKECNHPSVCDGGYGKKRCCQCDKIITDEEWQKIINQAEVESEHSDYGDRD